MTFIEVYLNEDLRGLEKLVLDSYTGQWGQLEPDLPPLGFGRIILWSGRMFQELHLPKGPKSFTFEDLLFRCSALPRARMQVGSMNGEVFTTPPEREDDLAARIHEGGRCGKEYMVRPFNYLDWRKER